MKLGPFLGVNNRFPRTKLRRKEGAFVADAVNVDIAMSGDMATRKGYASLLPSATTHSLWEDLFVSGNKLYRLAGGLDNPSKVELLSGLRPGVQMSYTAHADYVLCSNGDDIWKVDGTTAGIAGVPTPSLAPTVGYSSSGALTAGVYQVCACFVAASGERSGTTQAVQIEVPEGSALLVTDIPQLAGHTTEVYTTPCNGTQFYRTVTTTDTSATIASLSNQDIGTTTLLMDRLPPGGIIRSQNGRVFTASGNVVTFTEPWSMLCTPIKNFIPFPAPVTIMEPRGNTGVFIVADKSYWYTAEGLKEVLPYGAVAGSGSAIPNSVDVCWMSVRGIVVGTPSGEVKNMQEEKVAVKEALTGTTLVREEDGMKQVVSLLNDPSTTVTAVHTYMDAEVIHTRSSS